MGGYDRTLRFINVEKRLVMRQLSPGEAFWSMSLSGSTLAIAMASGGVKIYDVYRNR